MSTWTPASHQHKVLFCGIVGAILARSVFIVAGLALLEAILHYGFASSIVILAVHSPEISSLTRRYDLARRARRP